MAMAGRKPKPTALKKLEGDRGKGRRPLNEREPIPPKGGVKCPAWLLPEAKKVSFEEAMAEMQESANGE